MGSIARGERLRERRGTEGKLGQRWQRGIMAEAPACDEANDVLSAEKTGACAGRLTLHYRYRSNKK